MEFGAGAPAPTSDERAAERVDVARAEREHQVALAQPAAQVLRGLGGRGHPGDGLAARRVGGRLGDEQPGHAGEVLRALARGVDVEHHDHVGGRQRGAELRAWCAVRENRCGWKTATRAAAPSVRAASIVAATSVGWCA